MDARIGKMIRGGKPVYYAYVGKDRRYVEGDLARVERALGVPFSEESFNAFPQVPNKTMDIQDFVWYRSESFNVNILYFRMQIGKTEKGLTTASIYLPKDGSEPYAAVYAGSARKPKDVFNKGNGLSVHELMVWAENVMGFGTK